MIGNKFLIDTNIIIEHFKGNSEISTKLSNNIILIPAIVIGELYFGAYCSSSKNRIEQRLLEIKEFCKASEIIETTLETSKIYGEIKSKLKLKGTPIPENNIWISAISIQHQIPLFTLDGHFK